MDTQNVLRTELIREINSLTIDKINLKRILEMLQVKATEAGNIEGNHIQSLGDSKVNLDEVKQDIDKCSILKITIKGTKGEDLFGSIEEVLNESIFPEQIQSVYVSSKLTYDGEFKYIPRNHFDLFIDFTKPKIFDFSIMPYEKTPNNSFLKVEGYDSTWVNGVYGEVGRFFLDRKKRFIHKNNSYDILVWLIGIPFSFWSCYCLSDIVYNISEVNTFLANAFFVYIFIFSLLAFRMLFHYSRWVYPMIEFKNEKDKAKMHRTFLYAIIVGMFGKSLYDLIVWIFHR